MSCPCQNDPATAADRHPCYSADAQHKFARLHLPVAPACNISCNYCNRKFDCVNESRPGVTSEVLTPAAALDRFRAVKTRLANLSVVGIAGPGDALANWPATRETLELIRAEDKEVLFCLSTNGLMLPEYAPDIVALGVRHVTVTVNCVDPDIGAALYRQVTYRSVTYSGRAGAEVLLGRQLAGIDALVTAGVLVKINIVMVRGINDRHIPAVVKAVKDRGVFVTNIMPMISAPGSAFEYLPTTSMKEVAAMRDLCQADIRQMRHCRQCRADAVGLLGEDLSADFRPACRPPAVAAAPSRPYKIAVATRRGLLVDLHFGQAEEFSVYLTTDRGFQLTESRRVPKYCGGPADCDTSGRKEAIAGMLADCDAVVSMRIGPQAAERLNRHGIMSLEACYTVDDGLRRAVAELRKQERDKEEPA
jgi:nitrogenase cofactor biosynthesis protein NifB